MQLQALRDRILTGCRDDEVEEIVCSPVGTVKSRVSSTLENPHHDIPEPLPEEGPPPKTLSETHQHGIFPRIGHREEGVDTEYLPLSHPCPLTPVITETSKRARGEKNNLALPYLVQGIMAPLSLSFLMARTSWIKHRPLRGVCMADSKVFHAPVPSPALSFLFSHTEKTTLNTKIRQLWHLSLSLSSESSLKTFACLFAVLFRLAASARNQGVFYRSRNQAGGMSTDALLLAQGDGAENITDFTRGLSGPSDHDLTSLYETRDSNHTSHRVVEVWGGDGSTGAHPSQVPSPGFSAAPPPMQPVEDDAGILGTVKAGQVSTLDSGVESFSSNRESLTEISDKKVEKSSHSAFRKQGFQNRCAPFPHLIV